MTEAAGLRANAEEELPPAKMTVEQALGQERIRAELRRALTMVWSAFAAIGAGFALLFRRAWKNPKLATSLTIVLSLVFSAWFAALVLPEREIVASPKPVTATIAAHDPVEEPREGLQPAVQAPIPPPKPREVWTPVRKPFQIYHLEAQDIEQAELIHRAATQDKHSRQDRYLWLNSQIRPGSQQRPAILLVVERYERGLPTMRPFFPDLAFRAAELDIVIERLQGSDEVQTKFGAMQVADAILESDKGRLACLAFRRIDTSGLVLAGWYCGTQARPADRVSFTCFIDRLDLVGAGPDHTLRRIFAEAERQRKACPTQRQPGRKVTWLDHEAPVPALKQSQRQR